jgi:hypothetical protein
MPSTIETDCNCPPPPSAPHIFVVFLRQVSSFFSIRQHTPLHFSAGCGRLEITRLLVESKADVAARNTMCFSPPPSHHLSLTICLAVLAGLPSISPSTTNVSTLPHTCAASALLNAASPPPPRSGTSGKFHASSQYPNQSTRILIVQHTCSRLRNEVLTSECW